MNSDQQRYFYIRMALFLPFLVISVPCFSQENRWYDGFFIEGSAVHYYLPELFSGIMKPQPGFRGALGYEYRRFRFAVESGYTRIEGTNPLVLDVTLIPLTAKFGYSLPLFRGIGLQADISFGWFFSRTTYYPSAIDMLIDNKQDERVKSPLAGARLYLTYSFLRDFIKIYAGGGADIVFENDGPIPPPVIEAGISIKPLAFPRPKARRQEPVPPAEPASSSEPASPSEPVETAETEIPQAPQRIVLSRTAVYFIADSTALIEDYRIVLDEAGRRLRANPALRITMRGYTAPVGTEDGKTSLSAARAWYCAEYLMRCYGIAENRMNIEFYGAEETSGPEAWEYRRRVDLIIEQGDE